MNKETEIRFRVSEEEKELIRKRAKEAGMKLGEFARYMSLGDCTVETKTIINTTTEVKIK
jgi:uncharacterized protein (DUF1778 family)